MRVALLLLLSALCSSAFAMDLRQTTLFSYGDSITAGWSVQQEQDYATNLALDGRATLQNRAISGQIACQMSQQQVFSLADPSVADGARYATLMIGTNDANVQGIGAYESIYEMCLRASLTWLAIPSSHKALANTAACEKNGDWISDSSMPLQGLISSRTGDSMRCHLHTDGGPLFIWYKASDASDGSLRFSIDALDQFQSVKIRTAVPIRTVDGRGRDGSASIEIRGLRPGMHAVTLLNNSEKDGSPVMVYGIGTPAPRISPALTPEIFVGAVPFQLENKKADATQRYADLAKSIVTELEEIQLSVHFVDTRKFMLGTAGEMNDELHPNPLGQQHLKEAFESAILNYTFAEPKVWKRNRRKHLRLRALKLLD